MGFRDSKFSIEARRAALEDELAEATKKRQRREAELPRLFFRLFPMLDNFSAKVERVDGAFSKTVLAVLLVAASVVALPLALLWHSQRTDVRALRAAKRSVRRLGQKIDEAERMLGPGDEVLEQESSH